MGRHGQEEPSRGGLGRGIIAAVIGVGLIAAVGFTARALMQDEASGESPPAATATSGSEGESDGAVAGEADGSASTSSASAEASSSSSSEAAAPPEELAACAAEVKAGEEVAAAASVSAKNWKTHYMAQVNLENGTATREETLAAWDKSKANIDDDIATFNTAQKAYEKAGGGCSALAEADVPEDFSAVAADCVKRAEALAAVAKTGDAVNTDWTQHRDMMGNKADIGAPYHEMWLDMVEDAPANMKAYEKDAKALGQAPTCEAA